MNDEQTNAINMGQAVQEVFTTYATFVATIPAGRRAFAKVAGHPEILIDVNSELSDPNKGRDQKCSARCLSILTHAQTNAASLAATLATRLEAFTGVAPKTKTMEFDIMGSGMKTPLEECDDLVKAQRIKTPPFFNDYRNTRRIDRFGGGGGGGGKKKPTGRTPPPA